MKILIRFFKLGPLVRGLRKSYFWLLDYGANLFIKNKDELIDINKIKKILLVRNDRIGDLILCFPVFDEIRKKFPEAEIDIVVKAYTKPLLERQSFYDNVYVWGEQLKQKHYDVAVGFNPDFALNKFLYRTKAKLRIGWAGRGGAFYLSKVIKDDREKKLCHETESAFKTVALLIDDYSVTNYVYDFVADLDFANNFIENNCVLDKKTFLLHPGSRQSYIRWTAKGYAELADYLVSKGSVVILLQGPGEQDCIQNVMNYAENDYAICRTQNLYHLFGILKKVDVFIGNSTGTAHIASVLGLPTIALFVSNHPLDSYKAWGPIGPNTKCIPSEYKESFKHPSDYKNIAEYSGITVDRVIQAVECLVK